MADRRKLRVLCGNCGCWYNAPEQNARHGIGTCGIGANQPAGPTEERTTYGNG